MDKVLTCTNQETKAQNTSLPEFSDQTSLQKNVKPGAPARASDSGVKHSRPDCVPIKNCSSRKEKAQKRGQIGAAYLVFFVIQSMGSDAFLRLKVKLKAYLSPKATHKNILIISEAEPTAAKTDFHCSRIKDKEQRTYKGLCEIHQKEQHASSSTSHI